MKSSVKAMNSRGWQSEVMVVLRVAWATFRTVKPCNAQVKPRRAPRRDGNERLSIEGQRHGTAVFCYVKAEWSKETYGDGIARSSGVL